MVIASGLMLWLPFLDSQVPSAYKISGNSTASWARVVIRPNIIRMF